MQLDDYFTEEQVVQILRLKSTNALKGRRATGTNHPPYIKAGNQILYPKDLFYAWLGKQAVIWEVKSAS